MVAAFATGTENPIPARTTAATVRTRRNVEVLRTDHRIRRRRFAPGGGPICTARGGAAQTLCEMLEESKRIGRDIDGRGSNWAFRAIRFIAKAQLLAPVASESAVVSLDEGRHDTPTLLEYWPSTGAVPSLRPRALNPRPTNLAKARPVMLPPRHAAVSVARLGRPTGSDLVARNRRDYLRTETVLISHKAARITIMSRRNCVACLGSRARRKPLPLGP